jgi:hypothetical protein
LLVALSLALIASLLMLAVARSPVRAGVETGTCTLEVVDSVLLGGASAVVMPWEPFHLAGEGWLPNSVATLDTGGMFLVPDEDGFDLFVDGNGNTGEEMQSLFNYGTFELRASQAAPACTQEVTVTVLPIADVAPQQLHMTAIKWLYLSGITSGCDPDRFCPGGSVTRGQMATFLSRALDLPATSTDFFTDDESNKHEANINRLREADITAGCDTDRFCPDGLVTRAQMASFLARAFDLSATATDYFTDDETSQHEANINRLRAASITFGCDGENVFCPDGLVTRAQMASFLFRALN